MWTVLNMMYASWLPSKALPICVASHLHSVHGDVLDIFPANADDTAIRVEFFGDEIDRIVEVDVLTGEVKCSLELIPAAKVGHIGMYRDPETAEPIEYYCKLPADCANREVFVVDPMLATGGSAVAALDMLKKRGVKNIHFMCIIAAPEGVKRLTEAHPDVDVYIGALDDHLNEHKYIVPGLGDAGDRIFGTK